MNFFIASASAWLNFGVEGRVHPSTTMVALLFPALLLVPALNRAGGPRRPAWLFRLFGILAALMICLYLAAAGADLFSHVFIDHVEPGIASVSWLYWKGAPLYQDLVTQERYSIPYGPYLYVFVALFQAILGPSIFATKLPCVLAGALSLLFLFLTIRKGSTPGRALCLTGLAAALLLTFGDVSFWTRPDPFMILAVTLGLFATTLTGMAGPILLGLSIGVAVNLKADAFLYFLPSLVLASRRKWRIAGLLPGMAAMAVAGLLPFAALHNISVPNFLGLLKINSQRAFEISLFEQNLHWFAFLFVPVLAAFGYAMTQDGVEFRQFVKRQRLYLAAMLVAFFLILPPASLIGAGTHHLIPFVPVILLLAADVPLVRWNPASRARIAALTVLVIASAWVAACLVQGVAGFYRTFQPALAGDAQARRYEEDLKQIVHDHPADVVLSGAGSSEAYPITFSRYILAFEGMPIGAAPNVMMDFEVTGHGQLDFESLVNGIEQQRKEPVLFVIPKNAAPFSMYSLLPNFHRAQSGEAATANPYQQIYPEAFRLAFARDYVLSSSTEFFDVYTPRVPITKL